MEISALHYKKLVIKIRKSKAELVENSKKNSDWDSKTAERVVNSIYSILT